MGAFFKSFIGFCFLGDGEGLIPVIVLLSETVGIGSNQLAVE
ncbi:MAG: hypothetical protein P8N19_03160 [Flavobacteriales bacterium]|nr:hypothetical protein [Flavobacteriales bacterium]